MRHFFFILMANLVFYQQPKVKNEWGKNSSLPNDCLNLNTIVFCLYFHILLYKIYLFKIENE